jgi:hypothetical protein
MGTKLKIIFFVFAVVVGLYAIQYMVTSVTTSSSSKKESFENDSGDEKPNEKAAKKDEVVSKSKLDKEVKLNILENVESTFAQLYPKSDKKPMVFEVLTRQENFEEIKEKYEEDSETVSSHIRKLIKKTMTEMDGSDDAKKEKTKEDYEQEMMDKPLKVVVERLEQEDMRTQILAELDELTAKIATLQRDVKKLDAAADTKKESQPPKKESTKKEEPVKKEGFNSMMVEGFENRLNYASY